METDRTRNQAELTEEDLISRFRSCLTHGFGEIHVYFKISEKGKRSVVIQGGTSSIHTMDESELKSVR